MAPESGEAASRKRQRTVRPATLEASIGPATARVDARSALGNGQSVETGGVEGAALPPPPPPATATSSTTALAELTSRRARPFRSACSSTARHTVASVSVVSDTFRRQEPTLP